MIIPKIISIGGQDILVEEKPRLESDVLGECSISEGFIHIANTFGRERNQQSPSSKRNTFYHELTHCILDTMGKHELSEDESFVQTFGSFLCEAMSNADFVENGWI